jgi:phosphatidylglycerophosphate synthase
MIHKLRKPLDPFLKAITAPFLWIHPNTISLLTLLFSVASGVALSQGRFKLGALLFAGNILDVFDGYIARAMGKTSRFGGVLDTVLDRVAEAIFFFGAAFGGLISFELGYIAIVTSLMVSFIKAVATAAMGETKVGTNALSIGIGQRGDRLVILLIATYFATFMMEFLSMNLLEAATWLVVILSVVTFLLRFYKSYVLLDESSDN